MESGTKFRLSIIVTAYMELGVGPGDHGRTSERRLFAQKHKKSRERVATATADSPGSRTQFWRVDNIQPPPSKRRGLQ